MLDLEKNLFISVIICTHNPRWDYLKRTLTSLRSQTLSEENWELLLIDNASTKPMDKEITLSWHSQARHLHENELGLTPARLRGIREARADILVFVDDDNVLAPDFLEQAIKISDKWPILGVWGGEVLGEFETAPPEWTRPMWPSLSIRPLVHDAWSNVWGGNQEAVPYGTGLCIRKQVAREYAYSVSKDRIRRHLGRRGNALTSGEDVDIVLTAYSLHLGSGRFKSLRVTHMIPAHRMAESYLVNLAEALEYSWWLLQFSHGYEKKVPLPARWRSLIGGLLRFITMPRRERSFYAARLRGRRSAAKVLENYVRR